MGWPLREDRGGALWAWVALVLTLAIPLGWGAAPQFPWDVDNIAPGSVLRGMSRHFGPGWSSSYGPVPYGFTALVYAPALIVMRVSGELGDAGPVYPWGFAHPERSLGLLVVLARLVTAAFALVLVALAARSRRDRHDAPPAWATPVLFLGSAVFCYYARTSNVDLHYLFWLWLGFDRLERPRAGRGTLALAAAAAALAVCCKEQSAPLAAVIAVAAVARAARRAAPGRALRDAVLVGLAAALAYAIAWGLPFNLAGWRAHHQFIFTQARYPRTFPLTVVGIAGLLARLLTQLPATLGPLLSVAVLVALVLRTSARGLGLRVLACAAYLLAFLLSVGYVYPRFLLPFLLPAIPLGARALADLERALRPARGVVLAGALALAALGGPALSYSMLHDPRLAAERWMRERVPAGALIEIAGNPHYQARVPYARTVLRTDPDSLALAPRGPRGDVVLLSSIDAYTFARDSTVKRVFLDSLRSTAYRAQIFRSGPTARLAGGLPVVPNVTAYVLRSISAP
jgi:hypothetical protein